MHRIFKTYREMEAKLDSFADKRGYDTFSIMTFLPIHVGIESSYLREAMVILEQYGMSARRIVNKVNGHNGSKAKPLITMTRSESIKARKTVRGRMILNAVQELLTIPKKTSV